MATLLALAAPTGTPAPGALMAGAKSALDSKSKARETATDFESVFLSTMFNHMFAGLDGDGPLGGAGGAGMWRSFLAEEYGKTFAKSGGIGLADSVYATLIAQQETGAR